MEYVQNDAVMRIHNVPRFGHSSQLSDISTGRDEDKEDYIRGITAFTIFCLCLIIVWSVVLLILKFYYKAERVGCAARGEPVDPTELRNQGVTRRERKKRIQRAWRVQICFLSLSMMIPGFTCLLVNHGYRPFMASLGDISQINDDVEARVFRGVEIASSLTNLARDLRNNELLDTSTLELDNLCPNFDNSTSIVKSLGLDTLHDDVSIGIEQADEFLRENIEFVKDGLSEAAWATKSIDKLIEHVMNNDWYLKLLLVLLNVFNILLWIGAFLTKIGIDFGGYQKVMAWFALPAFGTILVAIVAATGLLLSIALVNADFCSGGPSPGSPHGTLRSIVQAQGYAPNSILVQSLEHYLGRCESPNDPLDFLVGIQGEVRDAGLAVAQLVGAIHEFDIDEISAECGRDLSPFLSLLESLSVSLISTAGYLRATVTVTDCREVSEILDEVFNGAVCNETVKGLGWMFGGLLALTFIVMMMFSTRAALFNPVHKPKRRRRREREFDEYREFMVQFYADAGQWKMDPEKKAMLRVESADTEEISNFASASSDSPDSQQRPTVVTDLDTTFHTVHHQKFTEQIVMTPLTKAAVAAGARAAAQAAERALLENTSLEGSGDRLDESYESSSSSDESEGPSIISNISTIVDRFFNGRARQRERADMSISSFVPSTPDSRDAPPSDYAADPSFDLLGAMNKSFDSGSELDCYIEEDTVVDEAPTPMVDRSSVPRPNAPHKTVKSLGRTKGGSALDD